MIKVSAVVTLYNSDMGLADRIRLYLEFVDKVYIMDNSDDPKIGQKLAKLLPKAEVYYLNGNKGIAAALNQGIYRALSDGSEWVLTMDQDSEFQTEGVSEFFADLESVPDRVALISPKHILRVETLSKPTGVPEKYTEERTVMASGNLLRVRAFQNIGPFLEELFIDRVDNEFCLRLVSNGWKIFRKNSVALNHPLGVVEVRKPGWIHRLGRWVKGLWDTGQNSQLGLITISIHSAMRRYYFFRNSLFVGNLYKAQFPDYYCMEKRARKAEIKQIIKYENQKIKKLVACFQGWLDYKKGKLGIKSGFN